MTASAGLQRSWPDRENRGVKRLQTHPERGRLRLPIALLGALALAFVAAPSALADSTQSSNWAGYAVHRSGVRFTRVFGAWRQPTASCLTGVPTFSSVWVGLGGYSERSNALEQIGSEVDCSARGKVVSSVWYELVPSASRTIRMTVNPGDQLTAAVNVNGHQVRLELTDLTRHRTFTRTVRASTVDVSSADWILEAPSECTGNTSCQTLALADFGSATFSSAQASTTTLKQGSISSRNWDLTRITLATSGRRFIGNPSASTGASALPSALSSGGTAFTVTYRGSPTPTLDTKRRRPRSSAGVIVRPARS
jgi:hypothetical protein